MTLTYENAVAYLSSSFSKMRKPKGLVIGTKGSLLLNSACSPSTLIIKIKGKRSLTKCLPAKYIYQFDKVSEDIKASKKESEEITKDDSIEIMRILDECRHQMSLKYDDSIEKI